MQALPMLWPGPSGVYTGQARHFNIFLFRLVIFMEDIPLC
jgi:hypothetical protein